VVSAVTAITAAMTKVRRSLMIFSVDRANALPDLPTLAPHSVYRASFKEGMKQTPLLGFGWVRNGEYAGQDATLGAGSKGP
jgi:hypothetical protein